METFFVIGQIFQWVGFRAAADMLTLVLRSVTFALAVIYDPDRYSSRLNFNLTK